MNETSAGSGLASRERQITTTKLARGHYRIDREDGYSIEVRRSGKGDWYQVGNMVRFKSLSVAQFDMRYGYMARDQISHETHSEPLSDEWLADYRERFGRDFK